MKVAVFCAYFYPHEGGMEKYVQKLFSGLKNIDVTIITCNTEHNKFHEKKIGLNIYRLDCWNMVAGNYPVLKPSGIKQLLQLFSKSLRDTDWVITNTRFFNISFFGTLIAHKYAFKHMHIEHGTTHSKQGNIFVRLVNVVYDHTFGRYVIKNATIVAGVSEAANEFSNHIYRRETSLIRNCIDTKNLKKISVTQQARCRKTLDIKKEKIITFVGRAIKAKGIQDLLESTKNISNVKVLIIGDGNYLKELKNRYTDAKYKFLGQKNISEIRAYLSITDIFVNPSYAEGLPTSVLEAGAVGVACIATDVGGTREIIEDGINGYLIETKNIRQLKDKLIKLLDDDKLRKKYAEKLQLKVRKEFTWEKSKGKVQTLLNS